MARKSAHSVRCRTRSAPSAASRHRGRVAQIGAGPGRVSHGHRVVHGHDGALGPQPVADVQAGRVADVVAVGLERDAEHGRPARRPGTPPTASRARSTTRSRRPRVDGVDRAEQARRTELDAELGGRWRRRRGCPWAGSRRRSRGRARGSGRRSGRRGPARSASRTTSAPAASHTSAIALMNEILVARNAFAATLTSSAVARSGHAGMPARERLGVDLAQRVLRRARRAGRRTRAGPGPGCPGPRSPRAGTRGSRPGRPQRPPAPRPAIRGQQRRAPCPTGTVDLPTIRQRRAQVRGQRADGGVDVAQVGGSRPASAGCRRRGSGRRRTPRPPRTRW